MSQVLLGLVGLALVWCQEEGSGSLPAGSEDILQTPYQDTFSCDGLQYGYYADIDSGCQVGTDLTEVHTHPTLDLLSGVSYLSSNRRQ